MTVLHVVLSILFSVSSTNIKRARHISTFDEDQEAQEDATPAARSVSEGKNHGSLLPWCEGDRRWPGYYRATNFQGSQSDPVGM